jgi:hypothetical protein
MDLREEARQRAEIQMMAKDGLNTVIGWIQAMKPDSWLPGGKGNEELVSQQQQQLAWRDFVDRAGKLMEKAWDPADLMIDDLQAFMKAHSVKSEGASEV